MSLDIVRLIRRFMRKLGMRNYSRLLIKEIFLYVERYTITVLEDAIDYASHSRKPTFDMDDVLLAAELLRQNNTACGPHPKIVTELPSNSRKSVGWQSLNYDAIFKTQPEEPESSQMPPSKNPFGEPLISSVAHMAEENSLHRRVFSMYTAEEETIPEVPAARPKFKRKRGSTRFTRNKRKKKQ